MAIDDSSKVVLVTGANQGLGFSVIQSSGLRYPQNVYILCSRNPDKGEAAIAELRKLGVTAKIDLVRMEVTNDDHIAAAVAHVEAQYGRLDVLVNNAGFVNFKQETELSAIRVAYNEYMNVHITSVAVITAAFTPLLHRSRLGPKVINVTSGLGSISNTLSPSKKMARVPPYGASKVGLNGLTAHLQVQERERDEAEPEGGPRARIRFFISVPGLLKTAFSNFIDKGKDPLQGAESIVQLLGDDEGRYDGGVQWEYEEGEMRIVPW